MKQTNWGIVADRLFKAADALIEYRPLFAPLARGVTLMKDGHPFAAKPRPGCLVLHERVLEKAFQVKTWDDCEASIADELAP